MDNDHFLHLCVEKGISIITHKDENLDRYKKLTEHFNYLCDFDENGVCSARTDSACCCSNCGHDVGYFKKIRDAVNRVDEYASKYNEVDGFWRHKIGCTLPRELRSTVCTAFICGTTRSRFKYRNSGAIMMFMRLLYGYNSLSLKNQEGIHKLYINIKNTL